MFESAVGAWTSNLTGAGITAVFTGGLTLLTGAAGAAWAKKTERDVVEYIETTLKFRKVKSEDGKGAADDSSEPNHAKPLSAYEQAIQKGKTELRKLQDAHEAGILDENELTAKKKDLEAKIPEWEIQLAVEGRSEKLRAALQEGILEQLEYDAKLAALEQAVRQDVESEQKQRQNEAKIAKLKAALESGVLNQKEYDTKLAALV